MMSIRRLGTPPGYGECHGVVTIGNNFIYTAQAGYEQVLVHDVICHNIESVDKNYTADTKYCLKK